MEVPEDLVLELKTFGKPSRTYQTLATVTTSSLSMLFLPDARKRVRMSSTAHTLCIPPLTIENYGNYHLIPARLSQLKRSFAAKSSTKSYSKAFGSDELAPRFY